MESGRSSSEGSPLSLSSSSKEKGDRKWVCVTWVAVTERIVRLFSPLSFSSFLSLSPPDDDDACVLSSSMFPSFCSSLGVWFWSSSCASTSPPPHLYLLSFSFLSYLDSCSFLQWPLECFSLSFSFGWSSRWRRWTLLLCSTLFPSIAHIIILFSFSVFSSLCAFTLNLWLNELVSNACHVMPQWYCKGLTLSFFVAWFLAAFPSFSLLCLSSSRSKERQDRE